MTNIVYAYIVLILRFAVFKIYVVISIKKCLLLFLG